MITISLPSMFSTTSMNFASGANAPSAKYIAVQRTQTATTHCIRARISYNARISFFHFLLKNSDNIFEKFTEFFSSPYFIRIQLDLNNKTSYKKCQSFLHNSISRFMSFADFNFLQIQFQIKRQNRENFLYFSAKNKSN